MRTNMQTPSPPKEPTIRQLTQKAHKTFLLLVLALCVVGLCGFTYLGIITAIRSTDAVQFRFIVCMCVAIFDFIMLYIFWLTACGIRALKGTAKEEEMKDFSTVIVSLFTLLIALVAVVLAAENFIKTLFSS